MQAQLGFLSSDTNLKTSERQSCLTSMDPLSALSIAGNVIQFLDFATKLFKESREISHSASGSSKGVTSLAEISAQLSTLSKSFTAAQLQSLGLKDVASQCDGVAKELQSLVERLTRTKPDKDGYWASFALALKTLLKKGADPGPRASRGQCAVAAWTSNAKACPVSLHGELGVTLEHYIWNGADQTCERMIVNSSHSCSKPSTAWRKPTGGSTSIEIT